MLELKNEKIAVPIVIIENKLAKKDCLTLPIGASLILFF